MKLVYYRGTHPNFGDELNTWMFPKLFPNLFDDDGKVLFIGIGSTLGDHYDDAAQKVVFGTGFVPQYYPQHYSIPDLTRGDWNIYFVRGPRTAKALSISPDLALGDSALLLRTIVSFQKRSPDVVSFIPHWESLERGNWEQVCRLADINLIDPRRPVEEVIKELLRSRLVVAEAMHGAIVSDAFRIPWIPVLPLDAVHRQKWFDWAEAMGIILQPDRLWPSSMTEAQHSLRCRTNLVNVMHKMDVQPLSSVMNKAVIHIAAHRLSHLSRVTPNLSEDSIMNSVTERMLDKAQQVRKDYHVSH